MTVYGWDASDYDWDRGPMDYAAAARDGIVLATHKASEGTTITHQHFGEAMRRARDARIPVLGAYHVVRSPRNAQAEVDFCLRVVTAAVPWWRDWPHWIWQVDLERWPYDAVPASEGEDFADLIEAQTGRRAVIYASRGQYGDALQGTSHDLWNAHYGSNPATHYVQAYPGDGSSRWAEYSGRVPVLLQYGSRVTIGRQAGCDVSAFRGSLSELLAWAQLARPFTEENHMPELSDAEQRRMYNMIVNGENLDDYRLAGVDRPDGTADQFGGKTLTLPGKANVTGKAVLTTLDLVQQLADRPPVQWSDADLDRLGAAIGARIAAPLEQLVGLLDRVGAAISTPQS